MCEMSRDKKNLRSNLLQIDDIVTLGQAADRVIFSAVKSPDRCYPEMKLKATGELKRARG